MSRTEGAARWRWMYRILSLAVGGGLVSAIRAGQRKGGGRGREGARRIAEGGRYAATAKVGALHVSGPAIVEAKIGPAATCAGRWALALVFGARFPVKSESSARALRESTVRDGGSLARTVPGYVRQAITSNSHTNGRETTGNLCWPEANARICLNFRERGKLTSGFTPVVGAGACGLDATD